MTYACESCGFLFRRLGAVERCPYCDGTQLRPADAEEQKRLEEQLDRERTNGGNP